MRLVFALLSMSVFVAVAGAAEFHVASGGDDGNAGTAAAPFATLDRAREAVRALKEAKGLAEGGITVWVHEGRYGFEESFVLSAADGGEDGRPVVYRAAPGENVCFVGGRVLPAETFKAVADEGVLARIDEAVRDDVRCADLAALGIEHLGEYPDAFRDPPAVPELFFDDERMMLARWPNEGWAEVAEVVESGPAPWRHHESDQVGTFAYAGDRPARWKAAPEVWLHGYWCFDWCSETIKAAEIDTEKKHITFVQSHGYGIGSGNPGPRRYYVTNVLEELDRPGEYFVDREGGMLYFLPPGPLASARVVLSVLTDPVAVLEEASHVVLRGLTFEACAGTALRVAGGARNEVLACLFRNTGHDAVVVDGGEGHRVAGCDIHDTGTAGIRLKGGDRETLRPCGHVAENNHIWRVSRRKRTHAYHVHLAGVGIRLAHNLLHDAPHQSIGLAGNDHVIEFNEIHHTGQECDDCGSFYMGRNPSERGSVLRYNFWHDTGSARSHGSCAVYFDDGSGGQKVLGNVFCRAAGGSFGAVFSHGGHDNYVMNCVFVDCLRALGSAPWDDERWAEQVKGDLWQDKLLKEVDITKAPYLDVYPDVAGFMEPSGAPRHNHASKNVLVRCGEVSTGNWKVADSLVTEEDPGFVDAGSMNFALKADSAVFEKVPGFEAIPFGEIGLYEDELRQAVK